MKMSKLTAKKRFSASIFNTAFRLKEWSCFLYFPTSKPKPDNEELMYRDTRGLFDVCTNVTDLPDEIFYKEFEWDLIKKPSAYE